MDTCLLFKPRAPDVAFKHCADFDYLDKEPETPMPCLQSETFQDVLPVLPPLESDLYLSDDDEEDMTVNDPITCSTSNISLSPSPATTAIQPVLPKMDWQGFKIPKLPCTAPPPPRPPSSSPPSRSITSKYFSNENVSEDLVVVPKKFLKLSHPTKLLGTTNERLGMQSISSVTRPPNSGNSSFNTSHSSQKPSPRTEKFFPHKTKLIPKKPLISQIPKKYISSSLVKVKRTLHPDLKSFVDDQEPAVLVRPFKIEKTHHVERVKHFKRPVAMCVLRDGFTMSDGNSASSSARTDLAIIAEELASFEPNIIILVGVRSKKIWNDIKISYADYFSDVKERGFKKDFSVGKCIYCQKEQCHRWKAVVGGIGRWKRTKVTPIKH